MIRLPSGQVMALGSERARLHALRLGLSVDATTPRERLASLVDILYLDRHDASGCKAARHFTGYTLGDHEWLARWRADDRAALAAWLEEPRQRQEIEAARRRVMYDSLPQRVRVFDYPRRLYSLLARRVAALPMARASAAQWRATLSNMARNGIRHDELRWCGVLDFLSATDPRQSIHRDDIRRRIGFPGLRLELSNELVRAGDYRLPFREVARLRDWRGQRATCRYLDEAFGYCVLMLKDACNRPRWQALDPMGDALGESVAGAAHAQALASRDASRRHGLKAPLRPSDRYGYLALAGGEDYREWLLTLPEFPDSHFTPHFTERNLLLHFRTTRRVDPHDGERMLFIEEIQSDWHQCARTARGRNPWDRPPPRAPFAREWLSLALKLILIHAVDSGIGRIAWAPASILARRFRCGGDFLARIYDRDLPYFLARLSAPWDGRVGKAAIATRDPWLCVRRHGDHWWVGSADGRFSTSRRWSREQAVALSRRHARRIVLDVPAFEIPARMREVVANAGMPLFGESFDRVDPVARGG